MCNVCKQKWFVYSIGGGFHRVLAWFSGRTLGLNNNVLPEGHAKFFFNIFFHTLLAVLGPYRVRLGAVLVKQQLRGSLSRLFSGSSVA